MKCAEEHCVFCTCTPAIYKPPQQAFSPHISSGYSAQQNSQPVMCQVEEAEPIPQHDEVRDIRWMKISELRKIFEDTPEKIFTLHLDVLEYYLQHDRSHP